MILLMIFICKNVSKTDLKLHVVQTDKLSCALAKTTNFQRRHTVCRTFKRDTIVSLLLAAT